MSARIYLLPVVSLAKDAVVTTSPLHRLLLCASCMGVLALAGCGRHDASDAAAAATPAAATSAGTQADKTGDATRALIAQLRQQLDRHRRIIVLLADEDKQGPRDRATSSSGPAVVS